MFRAEISVARRNASKERACASVKKREEPNRVSDKINVLVTSFSRGAAAGRAVLLLFLFLVACS